MNNEIQTLLLSTLPLWISTDGYRRLMVSAFPLNGVATPISIDKEVEQTMTHEEVKEYLMSHTWYQYMTHQALCGIQKVMAQQSDAKEVNITDDYASPQLKEGTIAYHRIFGVVTASSNWYFSSKQLEMDIMAAEDNPGISAHLLHINSM